MLEKLSWRVFCRGRRKMQKVTNVDVRKVNEAEKQKELKEQRFVWSAGGRKLGHCQQIRELVESRVRKWWLCRDFVEKRCELKIVECTFAQVGDYSCIGRFRKRQKGKTSRDVIRKNFTKTK